MHYRWKATVVIDYKLAADRGVSIDDHANLPTITKTGISTWDVWDSEKSLDLRIQTPTLNEKGDLVFQKMESILSDHYAILQYYDCTTPSSPKELTVCSLQVIPSFGNSREYEVNELQAPYVSAWGRSLLTGKLPLVVDGIKVAIGPRIIYKNYGSSTTELMVPTSKFAFHWTANYKDGKVTSLTKCNGFNGNELHTFRNIKWNHNRIGSFELAELSIQARKLVRPRTTIKFDLVSVDNSSSDVRPFKGARVFDYRLCPPVPLNSFPNKDCAPKTYECKGSLPSLAELKNAEDAGLNRPEPQGAHSAPIWIITAFLVILLTGVIPVWRSRTRV
jgi:hypothetical protein